MIFERKRVLMPSYSNKRSPFSTRHPLLNRLGIDHVPFRLKLILAMTALGILIVMVLTAAVTTYNQKMLIHNTLENNSDLAAAVSIHIDNFLKELVRTTKTLATSQLVVESVLDSNRRQDDLDEGMIQERIQRLDNLWQSLDNPEHVFIQRYLSNPTAEHLKEQKNVIPDLYGEIFLTNQHGELIAATTKLTTFAHGHKYWWQAGYNNGLGKVFLDDRGYDESVADFVLGVVVPVYHQNEVIGILKSNMRIFDLFSKVIEDYAPLYKPGAIKIVRTDGRVVLELGHQPLSTMVCAGLSPSLSEGPVSRICLYTPGSEMLVSTSPITNTIGVGEYGFGGSFDSIDQTLGNEGESWVVLLEMPKSVVDAEVFAQRKQFLVIGLVSILVITLFAFVVVRNSTKGIMELVAVTEEIGHGNLNAQAVVKTKDEIGKLADAFNQMTARLKKTTASRAELAREVARRMESEARLKHLSQVDELTQLYNRRAFNNYLHDLMDEARDSRAPLSIIMLDLDDFKKINDVHGHKIGDRVLAELAQVLNKHIRKDDVLCRWGGEEFIILMPGLNTDQAYKTAERLRKVIAKTKLAEGVFVTASFGVTELERKDTFDKVIIRVDQAAYLAKSLGKNTVKTL